MVCTRPRNVPRDRETGRTRRASVAPTSEELQRRFHQLTLEEQRQLFNNPAPTPSVGRIPWHQAAASRSWIPTTSSATKSSIQVPEISSQSMEEDVEILEEPAPRTVNIQSSQAPTLPGDITSTLEGGNELTVVIPCTSVNMAEELMMLNNQYGAAAATIQEYVNRMDALEIYLEALQWTGRSGKKLPGSHPVYPEELKLGWNC